MSIKRHFMTLYFYKYRLKTWQNNLRIDYIQQQIIISYTTLREKKGKNILPIEKNFVLLQPLLRQKGRLAEGLGTGLQNLLLRFKSGSDLKQNGAS